MVRKKLEDFAGRTDVPVRELFDEDFVDMFLDYLLNKRGLKKATVFRQCANVGTFTRFCAEKGWIDERLHFPTAKRLGVPKGRIRYLDAGDIALYLAHMGADMRSLHIALIGTGIDLGEAMPTSDYPERGLRVCDLNFSDKGDWATIIEDKTEYRARQVYVWPWVAETLKDHVERHNLSGDDQLFTWSVSAVQKVHRQTCRLAGIHNYRIKDHRHTAAVAMSRAGVPLDLIQQQLGHGRIEQTMVYAKFNPSYGDFSRFTTAVQEQVAGGTTTPHIAPHTSAKA
jgi:integrase